MQSLILYCLLKIEIILIDDNSTDESFKVCEEISKKENNIKLIKNKKNQGVGISRNIGLSLSEGKYILFLDSDDRLKKNSLKKIFFELEKNKNSNFIIFDHDINIDGKLFKKKINNFSNEKKIKYINSFQRFNGYCWRIIYQNKFLKRNNIFFCNGRIYEDEAFLARVLLFSKKFSFSKINYYKKSSSYNSLSLSTNTRDIYSCITVLNEIINLLNYTKISKEKRLFIYNRFENVLNNFITFIFFVKDSHLRKISANLSKLDFKIIKKLNINHYIFNFKHNKNFLVRLKNQIEIKMKKSLTLFKRRKINLYCADKSSFATFKILKKNKFRVRYFFDSYIKSKNEKYGLKIKNLSKKNIKFFKEDIFLISNQTDYNIQKIINYLINLGIKKNNIIIKRYSKNLIDGVKSIEGFRNSI